MFKAAYLLVILVNFSLSARDATHIGVMGGLTCYSLMADFVPMRMRGRVNGLMATISGIATLPAPYIGAHMWETEDLAQIKLS